MVIITVAVALLSANDYADAARRRVEAMARGRNG